MQRRDRLILATILIGIIIFISYDIWSDYRTGSSLSHLAVETIIVLLAAFGAVFVLTQNSFLREEVRMTQSQLAQLKVEANQWKSKNQALIEGLSLAIDKLLQEWGLTPAEKEVALLLLKGLSFKEIGHIRESSEKTVRHQAEKIYEKSNLGGRAELSAFFLEDLLQF